MANAAFCHRCGTRIITAESVPQSPPTGATAAPQPVKAGRGGAILTLGILAVVMLGAITGIPAWVMGHRDLKEIRAGMISQQEYGMTMAGMVLGIIGTALSAIIVIGIIVAISIAMIGIHQEFSFVPPLCDMPFA